MHKNILLAVSLLAAGFAFSAADPITPLHVQGENFVTPDGQPVRFWGVNLVSLYPTHAEAEQLAATLAERQINLVRPHHMLRYSADWIYRSKIRALTLEGPTTRQPDPEAWDRFDYLNAQLRQRGIYLQLSLHFSRTYKEADADIIPGTPADNQAWRAAIRELNSRDWRAKQDPLKMLPTLDPRANALQQEFARQLLTHRNPYTGLTYAQDPQVLTLEIVNESSAEYCLICGNTFPAYFQQQLDAKWQTLWQTTHQPGDPIPLTQLKQPAHQTLRTQLYRSLDQDYYATMLQLIRSTGSKAAVTYSNLWRGEGNLAIHATGDFIEDHSYINPLFTLAPRDPITPQTRTLLANKPYIIAELNQAEGDNNIRAQAPTRTQLPLAQVLYGSLHNYAGLVWFAWCHGDRALGSDGYGLTPDRNPHLGDLANDTMLQDHLRTCGLIYRNHLITPSQSPQVITVTPPYPANNYNQLMQEQTPYTPGWQNIHAIRKTFAPTPSTASAPHSPSASSVKSADTLSSTLRDSAPPRELPSTPPSTPNIYGPLANTNILTSDTRQITKNITRQQLTANAPQVQAFSGTLDAQQPDNLPHLKIEGTPGTFATIIAVAADDKPFAQSHHIIISRTALDPQGKEISGPAITLTNLQPPPSGMHWTLQLTRPRTAAQLLTDLTTNPIPLTYTNNTLTLPTAHWHEIELHLTKQ